MNMLKMKLLEYNVNPKLPDYMNWLTIEVKNVPRSVLQEWARHAASMVFSVKSSRYTLKEIKGLSDELENISSLSDLWGKYIYLTDDMDVNYEAHYALGRVAKLLEKGKSNDIVKTVLPEGFMCNVVVTMSISSWNHLYSLRSGKEVYKPFREIVSHVKDALAAYTPHDYEIQYTEIITSSIACRTCWDSHKHSDDGGEKDRALVKRVGVKFRHASILAHLIFRCRPHQMVLVEILLNRHYRKFIEIENNLLLINMRTVVEIFEDKDFVHKKELFNVLPTDYKYLVEDLIE